MSDQIYAVSDILTDGKWYLFQGLQSEAVLTIWMHENDSLKCSYAGWIARRTNAVKSNADRNKENVKVNIKPL